MWLVAGLGNPGPKYERTRHNAGFMVLERLLVSPAAAGRRRFEAKVNRIHIGRDEVVLVRPQTFMNHSGRSVGQAVRYYRVPLDRLLVVHDDLDVPFGRLKLVRGGGAGGHKGVSSTIAALGTDEFSRLRIGIDRPRFEESVERYVLSPFYEDQRAVAAKMIDLAADGVRSWLQEGPGATMNRFHGDLKLH
ncbi:MAG: aminoacyl-tRNA hydrolase [Proteobacteria bacterium]|nr:aminoacyl-tRNA hydrolase [Pseudomonadota bacterium]MBU1741559.1 aminoacyl-tRNA hydrolase [Pseudomonadota bacterium]